MRKPFSLKSRLNSFSYAIAGLKTLFVDEHNARIHLAAAVLAIVAGVVLKISFVEWTAVILCIALVFITEIVNTAVETLCNFVSPNQSEVIGKIKDLAASAVLVAAIASVIVACFVFLPKL